jgi:hypothetical protein
MSTTTAATPTTRITEIPIMVTYEAVPIGPGPFRPRLPAGNGWIEGRVNVHYACAGKTATVRVDICKSLKLGRPPKYGSAAAAGRRRCGDLSSHRQVRDL